MTVPARDDAPGPERHQAIYRWCDLLRAIATEARAARLAVEEMAAQPACERSRDLAESILAVMEIQTEVARRGIYDEERMQAMVDERVAEVLAGHGIRGRLRAL